MKGLGNSGEEAGPVKCLDSYSGLKISLTSEFVMDQIGMTCKNIRQGINLNNRNKPIEAVEGNTDSGGVDGMEKRGVNKSNHFRASKLLLRSFSSNNTCQ